MITTKAATITRWFKSPLHASVLGTVVSLILAGVINFLFLSPESLPMTLIITFVIAAPMSYITINGVVNMRTTIEKQRFKIAIEHERAEILSKFMRDAAHEFKTPLTLMSTNLYLAERTTDPEKKRGYSERTHEQIQTLNTLLETILILTRLDSTDKSTYPRELIKSTELLSDIRSFNSGGRLKIVAENPDSLPTVKVNLSDLHLALKQIVDNALRFSPETSEVTLKITVSDKQLIFEINDQGSGMSDETMQRIFDRFYRFDESHTTRGLGLGLSIAKRVIELHDGHIEIQSAQGIGTSFRAYIPVT